MGAEDFEDMDDWFWTRCARSTEHEVGHDAWGAAAKGLQVQNERCDVLEGLL